LGPLPGVNIPEGLRPERPYFDDVSPRNVTSVVGQVAVLRCRAKHIGNRTRDLHILTSHIFTYTGDARFSVLHPEPSDDWDLKIDYVQPRDAGVYECQINTEPKINMAVILSVEGCVCCSGCGEHMGLARRVREERKHDIAHLLCERALVAALERVRALTEGGTTSKLLVTKASLTDSGNYTCVPSNAHPASVSVHVLNGECEIISTTSKPFVTKVSLTDSGNYTCVPSNAHPASVSVHVLNGECEIISTTSKLFVTKASLTDSGNYTCVPSNAHPASVSVHVLYGECEIISTTSKLFVTKASLTDSGNYTCVPSNAHPASVSVYVLNGECEIIISTTNSSSQRHLSPRVATTHVCRATHTLLLCLCTYSMVSVKSLVPPPTPRHQGVSHRQWQLHMCAEQRTPCLCVCARAQWRAPSSDADEQPSLVIPDVAAELCTGHLPRLVHGL
ncbi:Dpr7, isoform G, partial [Operophtera brumata]